MRVTGPPLVSIILPVRNGEAFLPEALASIGAQTFTGFELLIIDDGSTDASLAIVREHAARDPRILVVERQHEGVVGTLNAGIALARGRYIARMDADDVALPTRLEKQIAFLDAHPECVAVGSAVELIDQEGEALGDAQYPRTHEEITAALMNAHDHATLVHPTVMVRRDALQEVGGYRSSRFPSEDLDLWLRLSDLGELANLPDQLLRYRRHKNSVSMRENLRQRIQTEAIVDDARRKRGLPLLPRRAAGRGRQPSEAYHIACARLALRAGRHHAARKHARAGIAAAPLSLHSYLALAASVVPKRAIGLLLRLYEQLRASMVPRVSSKSNA